MKTADMEHMHEKVDIRGFFDYELEGQTYEIEYTGTLYFGDSAHSMEDAIELTSEDMSAELMEDHYEELTQKALDVAHADYWESKGVKSISSFKRPVLSGSPKDVFDPLKDSDNVEIMGSGTGAFQHPHTAVKPQEPIPAGTLAAIAVPAGTAAFGTETEDTLDLFSDTDSIPVRVTDYGTTLTGQFGITGVLSSSYTEDELETLKENTRKKLGYSVLEYLDGSGNVIKTETISG